MDITDYGLTKLHSYAMTSDIETNFICTKFRMVQVSSLKLQISNDTGLQKNHAQENINITLTDRMDISL